MRNKKGNEEHNLEQEAKCSVQTKSIVDIYMDEMHGRRDFGKRNEEVIKTGEEKKEEGRRREELEVKMDVDVMWEGERMEYKNGKKTKMELKVKEKSDEEQEVSEKEGNSGGSGEVKSTRSSVMKVSRRGAR